MRRKFFRSGFDLVGAGVGVCRSTAWYLSRRVQRA
jgi:hypothetical protein